MAGLLAAFEHGRADELNAGVPFDEPFKRRLTVGEIRANQRREAERVRSRAKAEAERRREKFKALAERPLF